MTIATKLNLTVAVLIVCFLVIIESTAHGPLFGFSTNWLGVLALIAFAGFSLIYAILFIKRAREKGLKRSVAYLLLLVPVFCICSSYFGILKQHGVYLFSPIGYCTLLVLPLGAGNPRRFERVTGYIFALALVSIYALHNEGYKIFGDTYYYREPPPHDENWVEVEEIKPLGMSLVTGEFVKFESAEIPSFAFNHTQDDISVIMFHVPISDLYVRKAQSGEWKARFGNYAICSHPHFFPSREYGYYESSVESVFHDTYFEALNEAYVMDIHKRLALLEQY